MTWFLWLGPGSTIGPMSAATLRALARMPAPEALSLWTRGWRVA